MAGPLHRRPARTRVPSDPPRQPRLWLLQPHPDASAEHAAPVPGTAAPRRLQLARHGRRRGRASEPPRPRARARPRDIDGRHDRPVDGRIASRARADPDVTDLDHWSIEDRAACLVHQTPHRPAGRPHPRRVSAPTPRPDRTPCRARLPARSRRPRPCTPRAPGTVPRRSEALPAQVAPGRSKRSSPPATAPSSYAGSQHLPSSSTATAI